MEYDSQDDSVEGRLSWSSKCIHFAPTSRKGRGRRFDSYVDDDAFDTSLTQALQPDVTVSAWCGIGPTRCGIAPQPGAGSVALNAPARAAGLEVGVFFNTSEPQFGAYTG